MSELENLKKDILQDGVFDAHEVKQLEKVLYDDRKIDKDEAELVFALNDAVTGKRHDASWDALFIKVICDYVLKDEESPSVIAADKESWLKNHLISNGKIDTLERGLLNELKAKTKVFPKSLELYL